MRTLLLLGIFALAACVTDGPQLPDGNKPDYAEASRLNAALGADYLRKGQLDLAKEKLERAIEQDSDNALAHASLALVFMQRDDARQSRRHFRRALALDGDNPELKNNYGTYLCKEGDVSEALELFLEAARDRSYATPEVALTNAGACLRKSGDDKRVEDYLRQALQHNPEYPAALSQMALLSFEREDHLRARAFIQRFERVGRHDAQTLTLAWRTETQLGDRVAAARYQKRLKKEFPDVQP